MPKKRYKRELARTVVCEYNIYHAPHEYIFIFCINVLNSHKTSVQWKRRSGAGGLQTRELIIKAIHLLFGSSGYPIQWKQGAHSPVEQTRLILRRPSHQECCFDVQWKIVEEWLLNWINTIRLDCLCVTFCLYMWVNKGVVNIVSRTSVIITMTS